MGEPKKSAFLSLVGKRVSMSVSIAGVDEVLEGKIKQAFPYHIIFESSLDGKIKYYNETIILTIEPLD